MASEYGKVAVKETPKHAPTQSEVRWTVGGVGKGWRWCASDTRNNLQLEPTLRSQVAMCNNTFC